MNARILRKMVSRMQSDLSAILSRMFLSANCLANKRCTTYNTGAKNNHSIVYGVLFRSGRASCRRIRINRNKNIHRDSLTVNDPDSSSLDQVEIKFWANSPLFQYTFFKFYRICLTKYIKYVFFKFYTENYCKTFCV